MEETKETAPIEETTQVEETAPVEENAQVEETESSSAINSGTITLVAAGIALVTSLTSLIISLKK